MKHPALIELFSIISEPDRESRETFLETWTAKWVHVTEKTQYVVNKSCLNTDEIDFVWYRVAAMCAEDLMENQVTENETTNNSFSCRIFALRSPDGKLEKNKKSFKKSREA